MSGFANHPSDFEQYMKIYRNSLWQALSKDYKGVRVHLWRNNQKHLSNAIHHQLLHNDSLSPDSLTVATWNCRGVGTSEPYLLCRYIITCLCPNLVSFPFYAIPIFPFKFPKFFIYLSPVIFFLDLGTYISQFCSLLGYKRIS